MNYLFVFTMGVTIINLIMVISTTVGVKVIFPYYGIIKADNPFFLYPSFFYQLYWWSVYFELITS